MNYAIRRKCYTNENEYSCTLVMAMFMRMSDAMRCCDDIANFHADKSIFEVVDIATGEVIYDCASPAFLGRN